MKGIKWTHNLCTVHTCWTIFAETHISNHRDYCTHHHMHAAHCSFVSPHYRYLLPLLLSFSLVCAAWESTFLASWAFSLALSPSPSIAACVCVQRSVGLAHTDRNLTHQLQLASHKHWHTSFTEEVGHFNGNVWSACVYLKWIVTWFLLPGKVYKSLSSSFIE